ncbi:hypothetical protein DXG01_006413, partial [Tephrocybe rancida]
MPEPRTAATSAPRNLDARTPAHGAPHRTPTLPRHCKTNATAMRTHKPDPQTTHTDPTPRMHTTPDPQMTHTMRAHGPRPTNDTCRPHTRPRPRTEPTHRQLPIAHRPFSAGSGPVQLDSTHTRLRPAAAVLVVPTPTRHLLPTARLWRVVGPRLNGTLLWPTAAAPVVRTPARRPLPTARLRRVAW